MPSRAEGHHAPTVVHIDGAEQSGSGTLVRLSVAFAGLLGRPLRVTNARARRPKPGLRPQHVAGIRACAELCGAETEGLAVGSRQFEFAPGPRIRGGEFSWDIGTAGSTTMLALCVLPVACFADAPVLARIQGGVFQDFAPSPHHMQNVLLPLLARMGIAADLRLLRAGYVPRGGGLVELRTRPLEGVMTPLELLEPGRAQQIRGIAFASHLAARRVSERMAEACAKHLADAGHDCSIATLNDTAARHPGASLAIWAETSSGARLGADRAGAPRRSSEAIGRFVARRLLEDLSSGATTDRHAADQLALFAALARGTTRYLAPRATEHVASNLWLADRFGARTRQEGLRVVVEGLGLRRRARSTG